MACRVHRFWGNKPFSWQNVRYQWASADNCKDQCKVWEVLVLAAAALEWSPDSGLHPLSAVTIIYFTMINSQWGFITGVRGHYLSLAQACQGFCVCATGWHVSICESVGRQFSTLMETFNFFLRSWGNFHTIWFQFVLNNNSKCFFLQDTPIFFVWILMIPEDSVNWQDSEETKKIQFYRSANNRTWGCYVTLFCRAIPSGLCKPAGDKDLAGTCDLPQRSRA